MNFICCKKVYIEKVSIKRKEILLKFYLINLQVNRVGVIVMVIFDFLISVDLMDWL